MNPHFEEPSIDADFLLIARNGAGIKGYLQLIPSSSSTTSRIVLIHAIAGPNNQIISQLITEALMYSWELGFDAAFCSHFPEVLKELGFEVMHEPFFQSMTSNLPVYGYALSSDGLSKVSSVSSVLYH